MLPSIAHVKYTPMGWYKLHSVQVGVYYLKCGHTFHISCTLDDSFLALYYRLDKASEVFVNPTEPAGTQRSVLFDEEDEEDEEDNDDE